MRVFLRHFMRSSIAVVATSAVSFFGTPELLAAQSVCAGAPLLGENGPELCVHVSEIPTGASMDFRVPAGPGDQPLAIQETIGEYQIDLTITYVPTGSGSSIIIDGSAERTSAGTAGISVTADAGWSEPSGGPSGFVYLTGFSTGTSQTQYGSAAGYPVGISPAEDLNFVGFPTIIDAPTNGPGVFNEELRNQSLPAGAVAIRNIATFHINEMGKMIHIPGQSGVGFAPSKQEIAIEFIGSTVDNATGDFTIDIEATNTRIGPISLTVAVYMSGLTGAMAKRISGGVETDMDCTSDFSGWMCVGDGFLQGDKVWFGATGGGLLPDEERQYESIFRINGSLHMFSSRYLMRAGLMPPANPPTLVGPEDGAVVPRMPFLHWGDDPDATSGYWLQVANFPFAYNKSGSADVILDEQGIMATSFEVLGLEASTEYRWRVRSQNTAGDGPWTAERSFTTASGVATERIGTEVPSDFSLYTNYPNPFNPVTTIRFDVPVSSIVHLNVYNMLGQNVARLVNGAVQAGQHEAQFDARSLPSGTYSYRLETPGVSLTRTMVLLK